MLQSLEIKDYALIENIHIDFTKGLNIITGETGAGKSILIDAMGLLLGERASSQVVRKDASKSIIEGIFDIRGNHKIIKLLNDNEIENLDSLIVRREISVKGNNRCFINDTPVQLSLIQEIGNLLVDLHGQHDHQSLLKSGYHLEVIDDLGELSELIEAYKVHYVRISELTKELYLIKSKEEKLKQDREAFEFQLKEIDKVSPKTGEEEDLKSHLNLLENAESLYTLSTRLYELAYENEESAYDLIGKMNHLLADLNNIDSVFVEKITDLDAAAEIVKDISDFVRSYRDKIDLESSLLDDTRERLGAITLLKKRYGGTLEKVLEHRSKLVAELEIAQNFDQKIKELQLSLTSERKAAGDAAKKLSGKRKSTAAQVEKDIVEVLKTLGISNPEFSVRFTSHKVADENVNHVLVGNEKYKFNANGIDEIEFLISTNLGEELKPLVKVASGGEISRIMLALKTVLAKTDRLPLLIFDEIDTGVSGRIAQKVGSSLKELSRFHQIISITHLPQIACQADSHYSVFKMQLGSRVVSSIKKLNGEERVNEVAKLLSGEKVTDAALKSARELLQI
ncbi:MAG: DNA repair protein RecN [Melioribacteraceae bacterium]|nr:DNA repair protein RecN [Melioribacteraceae bacterium]